MPKPPTDFKKLILSLVQSDLNTFEGYYRARDNGGCTCIRFDFKPSENIGTDVTLFEVEKIIYEDRSEAFYLWEIVGNQRRDPLGNENAKTLFFALKKKAEAAQ